MRVCRDCLKQYRNKHKGATKPWPAWVYQTGENRNCPKHAALRAAATIRSHAKRSKRQVAWADKSAINAIYLEAAHLRAKGEKVQVDHVIPLLGETVSGLHVEYNLAILPASQNIKKGNRYV